jgi:hypothetical protein
MRRTVSLCAAIASLVTVSSALAGDWVTYANETSVRLVVDSGLGPADLEEKDYAWADLDDDGDTDLVVVRKQPFTSSGRRRNVLFMNEGGFLVDRTEDYATMANDGGQGFLDSTNDRDVSIGDLDGDGWLDIVTAPACNGCPGQPKTITHPRIYMNLGEDGGGNWLGFIYEEERIPQAPQDPNYCAVAIGDVTGDLAPDLYFVDYTSSLEDRLLINDGNGFYTDESEARMTNAMRESGFGTAGAIEDMNLDGWNDVVKSENGPVKTINNGGQDDQQWRTRLLRHSGDDLQRRALPHERGRAEQRRQAGHRDLRRRHRQLPAQRRQRPQRHGRLPGARLPERERRRLRLQLGDRGPQQRRLQRRDHRRRRRRHPRLQSGHRYPAQQRQSAQRRVLVQPRQHHRELP